MTRLPRMPACWRPRASSRPSASAWRRCTRRPIREPSDGRSSRTSMPCCFLGHTSSSRPSPPPHRPQPRQPGRPVEGHGYRYAIVTPRAAPAASMRTASHRRPPVEMWTTLNALSHIPTGATTTPDPQRSHQPLKGGRPPHSHSQMRESSLNMPPTHIFICLTTGMMIRPPFDETSVAHARICPATLL